MKTTAVLNHEEIMMSSDYSGFLTYEYYEDYDDDNRNNERIEVDDINYYKINEWNRYTDQDLK
jgi:hypothetical protein